MLINILLFKAALQLLLKPNEEVFSNMNKFAGVALDREIAIWGKIRAKDSLKISVVLSDMKI
jgi:hypothetical protein